MWKETTLPQTYLFPPSSFLFPLYIILLQL